MGEELKKIISKIKNSLKKIDNAGVVHPELNVIYDYCEEMEDVIYYSQEDEIDDVELDDDDDY